nr:DUF547 domain-containing protein [Fulvivirga sp. M361]
MKWLMILGLLFLGLIFMASCDAQSIKSSSEPPSHELWTSLLRTHVKSNGLVDYQGLVKDREKLEQYLDLLSANAPDPDAWTEQEKLAYWINVYNAFTIKLIVDNYPVESIKDLHPVNIPFVSSVWQKKFFKIGGVNMNLDQVEHSILRKKFVEPRIHFAVNCASMSCPPLRNEAFTADELEHQLTEQAINFINDPLQNEITAEEVRISRIFSWFRRDFTKNGSFEDFLNMYSKLKVDRGVDINYLDYDWKLNDGSRE